MFVDTHCHVVMNPKGAEKIVQNFEKDSIDFVVTIGTNVKNSAEAVAFANAHANVYATVGVYPEYAEENMQQALAQIETLLKEPKVVAIGEIGLDYHTPGYQKQWQQALFRKQLNLAIAYNKTVVIHSREATQDMLTILKEYAPKLKHIVLHCFSGSVESAKEFLSLGCYISFAGPITFKKTNREILHHIPLDRLLIETDSPYLAPEPVRGTVNEPANVKFVAQKIADTLEMPVEKLAQITKENAKRAFGIV